METLTIAWKVSKYGVFSVTYFPVFSLNTGKYGPEKTPYLDTFHVVNVYLSDWSLISSELMKMRIIDLSLFTDSIFSQRNRKRCETCKKYHAKKGYVRWFSSCIKRCNSFSSYWLIGIYAPIITRKYIFLKTSLG